MSNHHGRLLGIALLTITLAVTACGQDSDEPAATPLGAAAESGSAVPSASAASGTLPAGWATHETAGFSLALPERWQAFDAETFAEAGVLEQMIEDNPDLEGILQQAQAGVESGQIDFIAMELGPAAADGFAENVNVGTSTYGGSVSALEDAAVSQIEAGLPTATGLESGVTTLPAGEAVRLRYRYPLRTPAGDSFDVVVTQYMVLREGAMYILTFSATGEVAAEYDATFQGIAESLAPSE